MEEDHSNLLAYKDRLSATATQLLTQANALQVNINTAKTQTKRAYFSKKMAKVRKEVQQVLATLQLIKIAEDKQHAAANTTSESV